MNNKKLNPKYDFERETRVLLEKIGSDISTVAEGHGILLKNQDHMKAELETVKQAVLEDSQRIKKLEAGQERAEHVLDNVEHRLGAVEIKIDNVEHKLGTVESKIDNVDNRLGTVETKLDSVGHKLDTVATACGTRITSLEAKIS